MRTAELMGAHSHQTASGNVLVFQRDGKYLARGRLRGCMFGETLGADPGTAITRLRTLLAELDRGAYTRPSEQSKRSYRRQLPINLTFRDLASEFLAEKRSIKGRDTADDYRSRLAHVLEYAELPESIRRWRYARDIDRGFVVGLKAFLFTCQVTRNGKSRGRTRPISPRQVQNALETLRALLNWARRAEIRRLPADFVNPVTDDLIGRRPTKDPLRPNLLPMARRIELVLTMDDWQFVNLALLFVLPIRPEDLSGALISDVDRSQGILWLRTRFAGSDFNKGRVDAGMPLSDEVSPLLGLMIAGRAAGALLRKRTYARRRPAARTFSSQADFEAVLHEHLLQTRANNLVCENDRKDAIRQFIVGSGGVSEDTQYKELKKLFGRFDWAGGLRPYELRGAITNDMRVAGVRHLELRYLTEHRVDDILNDYTGIDPHGEMQKYYQAIKPLLQAISLRCMGLTENRLAS